MKHTIEFEDYGQDFLERDIIDGVVADCRPFEAFVWNGTQVAGNKSGVNERRFYRQLIRTADQRFDTHVQALQQRGEED